MTLRLREIRESKGISQTFIAKKLGFKSVSGYSAIENGRNKLDVERARQIADILGVSMYDLFFEENLHESCNNDHTA